MAADGSLEPSNKGSKEKRIDWTRGERRKTDKPPRPIKEMRQSCRNREQPKGAK